MSNHYVVYIKLILHISYISILKKTQIKNSKEAEKKKAGFGERELWGQI